MLDLRTFVECIIVGWFSSILCSLFNFAQMGVIFSVAYVGARIVSILLNNMNNK